MSLEQSTETRRLVVVGNGMVGWKFCDRLTSSDTAGRYRLTVFGDEPRAAYDRVRLTTYFEHRSAEELSLASREWYEERSIELRTSERITRIDRVAKRIETDRGESIEYDELVLATGSSPFVPKIPGVDLPGVFVYRTIEDLDAILAYAGDAKSCAVLGGGLLGLEAARAVQECGLETHIVELAPRLMPRQLDDTGARLLRHAIEDLGVSVHLNRASAAITGEREVTGLRFSDDTELSVDMVVISAGIRPRDDLGRQAELSIGERGGIVVDDHLQTSDTAISAIGGDLSTRIP